MKNIRRGTAVLAGAAAAALIVSACGAGKTSDSGAGIIVGTTDKVVSIDPAGAYDNGSLQIQTQVFQYLLNFPKGAKTPQPDAAKKCEFTKPKEFTCTMKDGLKFANGHDLTASDVAFSYKRVKKINAPNGPASLLGNMKSVEAPDDKHVVFHLKSPKDQTWAQVLVTSTGPIVDEEVFPPDKVMEDKDVVEAQAFSGPYTIGEYQKNKIAEFKANPDYNGAYEKPQADKVTMKYYASSNNLKLDIENGNIDVAWRTLTPTDIENLKGADGVNVYTGAGGELRYMVFNLKTMAGKNDEQQLAVRKAIAYSVDRQELSKRVYKGTYEPAYSIIPSGVPNSTASFKQMYGAKPDKQAAAKALEQAGVKTPVKLHIQYNPDHYGSNSDQEYNTIKRQLQSTGLFKVQLQSTEWTTYQEERVKDAYPIYQLGWYPDFPDADNYLTPFLGPNNFLKSHYKDKTTNKLLNAERTEANETKRAKILAKLQDRVAKQIPVLPLLSGAQIAVARDDISGVADTLDSSFKFRFTSLSRD